MKTKSIAPFLVIALLLSSLSGCGGSPAEAKEESGTKVEPQVLTLSPEATVVTTGEGITVDVGDYVREYE